MGRMSALAKAMNMQPKEKSKTQLAKKEQLKNNKIKMYGCKNCGATNTTLIKATDSYYCKFCFEKLKKTKFKK